MSCACCRTDNKADFDFDFDFELLCAYKDMDTQSIILKTSLCYILYVALSHELKIISKLFNK